MKKTFRVVVVLLFSTLIACLAYPFVQYLWRDVLGILDDPPARIFRRVWEIAAVAGLIIDRKGLGLRNPLDVGFSPSWRGLREFVTGLGVVWLYLIVLSALYLSLGFWDFRDTDIWHKLERLGEGFYQGMLVAFIEEYIFRGLIFFSLAARFGWMRSALLCSLIFSSLHFLEGRGMEELDPQHWGGGFILCGTLIANMAAEFTLFPDAAGLFAVGMILCYAAHTTGNLWYAAGLHGGWVWYSKFVWAVVQNEKTIASFYIGEGRLFNGVIPMFTMLLIFPITYGLARLGFIGDKVPR